MTTPADPVAADTEGLAEVIARAANGRDGLKNGIYGGEARTLAEAVLASDWLAARDRALVVAARACVNPAHLEPVTNGENVLRGVSPFALNARRTACKHGHAFTQENTYITPKMKRECRCCRRQRQRKAS